MDLVYIALAVLAAITQLAVVIAIMSIKDNVQRLRDLAEIAHREAASTIDEQARQRREADRLQREEREIVTGPLANRLSGIRVRPKA